MATTPGFANVPRAGRAVVSTANTARDGSGTIADILTGGSNGTKIEEIVVIADNDPADCTVTIFIHNGTDYRIFDEFDIGNPSAASTTLASYRERRKYDSLYLPSSSFKLAAAITVAPTAGAVNVWAMGADF